jgi:hypothetical protein
MAASDSELIGDEAVTKKCSCQRRELSAQA